MEMPAELPSPPSKDAKASAPEAICWRRELRIASLIALIPILIVSAFLLWSDSFDLVENDGVSLGQPVLTDGLREIFSGRLPWWSHHTGCGYPLFARGPFLYPPNLVLHAIGSLFGLPTHELMLDHLLHLGFGAFTAYLYLRFMGVGAAAAALGAIPYGLNGALVGLVTNWTEFAFWLPYAPITFILIERLLQGDRSWLWPCLGGLIGTLVFLATGPVGTIKLAILGGLYYLFRLERSQLAFSLGRLAIAAFLALLGASVQIAATHEWVGMTNRLEATTDPDEQGQSVARTIGDMAVSPEFYKGFVYPFGEFRWPEGFNWDFTPDHHGRFPAAAVFAGPLAFFAVCLSAVYFFRRRGVHRALLGLLLIYFFLSLGYFWFGNAPLVNLPFFRHYRWPVRWTPEFCAIAALLTGVGLELGWRYRLHRRTRWALRGFLVLAALAVTLRTEAAILDPASQEARKAQYLLLPWLLMAVALVYLFEKGNRRLFYGFGFVLTVITLTAMIPSVQAMRWGSLKYLMRDPLPIGTDTQERVLSLANGDEQRGLVPPGPDRGKRGEGNFAYCFPHYDDTRTVFTYGPYPLWTQRWQTGITMLGETIGNPEKEQATINSFLKGNLLETLRVGYVVVPRYNERLNQACRDNPRLELVKEYTWKTVYRHTGFREPAFFVQEVRPESELPGWDQLGRYALSRLCFAEDGYDGPRSFSGSGEVHDFVEDHGRITLRTKSGEPQLLVVTSTWYPGWQAEVSGKPAPLWRVNGSFMAVSVPAGEHEVVLEYRPRYLLLLLVLSVSVTGGLAVGCGILAWHASRQAA
jgi:hypothetical protein